MFSKTLILFDNDNECLLLGKNINNYHVNYECVNLKCETTRTSVNALWTVKSHNA